MDVTKPRYREGNLGELTVPRRSIGHAEEASKRARAIQLSVLAIVIVVVVGLVSLSLVRGADDRAQESTLTWTPAPDVSPTATSTAPPLPVAVFIGDSYTQGTGASDKRVDRWTTIVAAAEGWREVNLGRGGTGYVTTSSTTGCGQSYCASYPEMIPKAVESAPSVVVVSGGQVDLALWKSDPDLVRAAVDKTYSSLRTELPNARLVVIGPSATGTIYPILQEMDASIRATVESYGATYVSMIDPPIFDTDMVSEDGSKINDLGHQEIASRVLAALG